MNAKIYWGALLAVAASILFGGEVIQTASRAASLAALRKPAGGPQLVSVEYLPAEGAMCEREPASRQTNLIAALRQEQMQAGSPKGADEERTSTFLDRPPVRVIRNTYPSYSSVALDLNTDEVYLQDENLFGYKVFNRMDNTPPKASMTEPKRIVAGKNTKMDYNCAIYVDPNNGDVYSVANDVMDTLVVFPRDAKGNASPKRELKTPHMTFGMVADEEAQELYLTIQHPPAVLVYRKMAVAKEAPLRVLEGAHTGLADSHGIALDTKNKLMFVANQGAVSWGKSDHQFFTPLLPARPGNAPNVSIQWDQIGHPRRQNILPGSGIFQPPSITVYPLQASGDTPPLRVIQGPKTQLNWPAHIYLDTENEELFVANDIANSILVFRMSDNGDVAPSRVLKGPKTGMRYPTGVFVDTKHQELWVTNMGNHSVNVYRRTASGDVPPVRTIRSAPLNTPHLIIGNPGGMGYDSKREEILVPN